MALTVQQRKELYHKIVAQKVSAIYSSWVKNKATSKQIVAKANEYALDARWKSNFSHRFRVLVFADALKLRIEKRYRTILRKLLLLLPYMREKKAFALLKKVFGFNGFTDIREILIEEIEKLHFFDTKQDDRNTTGGGKRAKMDDLSIEEEMELLLEEALQEDVAKTTDADLQVDETDVSTDAKNESPEQISVEEREKISVDEFESAKNVDEEKKELAQNGKEELQEKKEPVAKNNQPQESKPIEKAVEKPTEKGVENNSNLAETRSLFKENEKKQTSSLETVQEKVEIKSGVEQKQKLNLSKTKNESYTNLKNDGTMNEKGESLDKTDRFKEDLRKSPFPVFRENRQAVNRVDAKIESASEKPVLDVENIKEDEPFHGRDISEENKARITSNVTMSRQQLDAIISQLHEMAEVTMKEEEHVWREQLSVEEGRNKVVPPVPNSVQIAQNNVGFIPKK